MRVGIIGAGLTGLMVAKLIEEAFSTMHKPLQIDVFEKSRSIGRLATRYKQPDIQNKNVLEHQQWQFDFGAPFFTAKTTEFKNFITPYIEQSILQSWQARVLQVASDKQLSVQLTQNPATHLWTDEQPRYIANPKMTAFGRQLANDLKLAKLHFTKRVEPLSSKHINENGATHLFSEFGEDLGVFDVVICTAPQGQAVELFRETNFEHQKSLVNNHDMLGCYSLMLGWLPESTPANIINLKWDVLQFQNNEAGSVHIIDKIFIEHHKPKRHHLLPSISIHANNQWSENHINVPIDEIEKTLLEECHKIFQWNDETAPNHIDCHRWRYASTIPKESCSSSSFYFDAQNHWIVTGDWCSGGKIESCFNCAQSIAEHFKNYYI